MKKIRVNLKQRSYDIIITRNGLNIFDSLVSSLDIGKDAIIITNPVIKRLFGKDVSSTLKKAGLSVAFEVVPDSEKAKSEKYFLRVLNNIASHDDLSRKLFVVSLGGGVVGDLAGFVASTYRRGIPYVQVPTTLLAQVDSSIGGKVAIDLKTGKNLIGAFYQPRLVFIDTYFLDTLPQRDFIASFSEIIKYGVIKSRGLFRYLERNSDDILKRCPECTEYIIYKCASIKARVVEEDEYDRKGSRVILNFGHTIGHAIESASGYARAYNHGYAVSLGIIAASFISLNLGLIQKSDYFRILSLIERFALPSKIKGVSLKGIMDAYRHDKKFIHGRNRLVLPCGIGRVEVREGIPEALVKKAVKNLML